MVDEMAAQGAAARAAQFLFDENKARARSRPIPEDFRPRTEAQAYAAQAVFQELLVGDGVGEVAGYKIGLTSEVMQRMANFDHPIAGAIFSTRVHSSPASISAADFVRLGIECEVAVRLGHDLPASGAPYDRDAVAGAVASCAPAFELIEDRAVDYAGVDILACVAENSWNAGIVLGPALGEWRDLDLAGARGELTINGAAVGGGRGGDVMGHPLEPLAWLANTLAERGLGLERGMVVMTGSIVTTKFLSPGDRAEMSIEGLGKAELRVE